MSMVHCAGRQILGMIHQPIEFIVEKHELTAAFVLQTGQLWMKQGEHEMAEGCFAAAMAHTAILAEACSSTAVPDARREQLLDSLAGLYTSRAQAAWALQQEVAMYFCCACTHDFCNCTCAQIHAVPSGK
jgi:hypothetical protein